MYTILNKIENILGRLDGLQINLQDVSRFLDKIFHKYRLVISEAGCNL